MAINPVRLSRLSQGQPIVDTSGRPVSWFLSYFNGALQKIESAFNGIISAQNAAAAAQNSADDAATDAATANDAATAAQGTADDASTTAAAALAAANSKLTQSAADARYVRQSQTSEWDEPTGAEDRTAYTGYISGVISDPPTAAEVQELSDAVQALSQRMVALISDLRGSNVLKS